MRSAGFYFLVFLLALAACLAAKTDRERTPPGGGPPESPGPLANVFYFFAKWICILSFLGLLGSLLVSLPPRLIVRSDQRKLVARRVQAAGGWNNLVQQSSALIATNALPSWELIPGYDTNFVLPPTVEAIRPRQITVDTRDNLRTVKLWVFGMRSSGARDTPSYWLVIAPDATNAPANLSALRNRVGRSRTIRQITNSVFEAY